MEADGLADLLVVVWVVLLGWQLQERLGDQLALAVPGAPHGLVQQEDGVGHVHVGGQTLGLRLALVIVDRSWHRRGRFRVSVTAAQDAETSIQARAMKRSRTRENALFIAFIL